MLRKLFGRPKPPVQESNSPAASRPADAARPLPLDVTDADFAQVVAASDKPAVVDFWADWCEPCRTMSAYVSFLAADYDGRLLTAALDVDENPAVAEQYQILGLPTLLFLRQGVEVARIVGVVAYDEIVRQVEQHLADS
jgi:thioredoxin 1